MPEQPTALLHGQADTKRNNDRIRRVLTFFAIGTVIAAAGIVLSLIWRDASHMNNPNETPSQAITIGITLVWGALVIFIWGMKLSPLLYYRRYLREITSGLSREVEGEIAAIDADTTFRDGLGFTRLVVNVGETGDPEDERVLYWDTQLGPLETAVGQRIRATAHGNDIIALKTL